MHIGVQYRLGAAGTGPGEGDKWLTRESCFTFWLSYWLSVCSLYLFVDELEDASSERGELGDEGSF
jgi:hypothetical protein